MKRRLLCVLLSVFMLVSLIPAAAFPASADSNMTTSEEAIVILKKMEGFCEFAYPDNGQYSIGYGSCCDPAEYPDGITETEADELLRIYLESMEISINRFISRNALTLTQNQFDALMLFTYNCGAAWTTGSGRFRQAVIDGTVGNDFLYAMTLWSNASYQTHLGLVKRRLIEADLYLNGNYTNTLRSNYTYVLLDNNGGVNADEVQGYDSDVPTAIKPTPIRSGYRFLGWYTKPADGAWVTTLNEATAGMTLYAHWQHGEGNVDAQGNILGTTATYQRCAASFADLNVYTEPTENAEVLDTVAQTDTLSIVADYVSEDERKWGKLESGGWVNMGDPLTPESNIIEVQVTVTNEYINVREEASASSNLLDKVYRDDVLTIVELSTVNDIKWGRLSTGGWISLQYTNYDELMEEENSDTMEVLATGKVQCSNYLNVRSGAGTTYPQVDKLVNGTQVNIYEVVSVNNHDWGRIYSGWICLDYVVLDEVEIPEATEPEVTEPEATEPEVTEPEVTEPEATEPEVTEPEVTEPEATEPEVTEPEVTEPEATEPEETEPEETEPETTVRTGVIANAGLVNVREAAGCKNPIVTTLTRGTKVNVYEQITKDNAPWGRIDQGWICLDYVQLDTTGEDDIVGSGDAVVAKGVVISNGALNIRSGPGTNYAKVSAYPSGTEVEIFEQTTVKGTVWGRTSKGWICMSYILLTSTGSGEGEMGTVTRCSYKLNIRSAPGTFNALVGTIVVESRVMIYEQVKLGDTYWGRIDQGWVSMDYIILDSELPAGVEIPGAPSTDPTEPEATEPEATEPEATEPEATEPEATEPEEEEPEFGGEAAYFTGTITGADVVNVRADAGTGNKLVGSLKRGTELKIYAYTIVDGLAWGLIDQGWICLSYVQIDPVSEGAIDVRIVCTGALNVRRAAGANNEKVGIYQSGTIVEIFETVKIAGQAWGRTADGWISLAYVM